MTQIKKFGIKSMKLNGKKDKSWDNADANTIKFSGGIFTFKKIKNRLFIFCPDNVYEIIKKKKGFKKINLCLKP